MINSAIGASAAVWFAAVTTAAKSDTDSIVGKLAGMTLTLSGVVFLGACGCKLLAHNLSQIGATQERTQYKGEDPGPLQPDSPRRTAIVCHPPQTSTEGEDPQ